MADDEALLASAELVATKLVTNKTALKYKGAIRLFGEWLISKHPLVFGNNVDAIKFENHSAFIINEKLLKTYTGKLLVKTVNGVEITTSVGPLSTLSSGLRDYYREHSIINDYPPEYTEWFMHCRKGQKRVIVDKRKSGELTSEGKDALTFTAYESLAIVSVTKFRQANQLLYSQLYTLLCWNLCARSDSVAKLTWSQLRWDGDCLVVLYDSDKTHQEGESIVDRHVYANPLKPAICPLLALFIRIMSSQTCGTHDYLFDNDAGSAYQTWLKKTLDGLTEAEQLATIGPLSIGTHSSRKGSAEYLSSSMSAPPWASVFLRMGWSIGNVSYCSIILCCSTLYCSILLHKSTIL